MFSMIIPPSLKPGDAVAIVAPAKYIPQEKYTAILDVIARFGYHAVRGKTTFLEHGPFAGTDAERLSDLQHMINNPDIKAIFCLRGGYGSIRIVDSLDFSSFKTQPKWLIGFSDITVLHQALTRLGVASVHGQMPVNFSQHVPHSVTALFNVLKGEAQNYTVEPHPLNRHGETTGQLTGGNLSILCSLMGTPFEPQTGGKILFIEDIGEYLYRLDRLMQQLRLAGKLTNLKALVVGGLTDMQDNTPAFTKTAEEIIYDAVKDYPYPILFGFPAGHIANNYPLVLGGNYRLLVNNKHTHNGALLEFILPNQE
jgi:muramoyltetrapeptide carboxypeptidase